MDDKIFTPKQLAKYLERRYRHSVNIVRWGLGRYTLKSGAWCDIACWT